MLYMQQNNLRLLLRYVCIFNEQLCGEELSIGLKCSWDFTDDLLPSEQASRNEKRKRTEQGGSQENKFYD